MVSTQSMLAVATAVNDEMTDRAYILIPRESRFSQVLPKFLADYGLEAESGGTRIIIPGPMAEEQAREYAALLNKRVDDFIAGTGSTQALQPRPIIQLPSIVFYPIKLDWYRVGKVLLWPACAALAVFVLYWLFSGIGYLVANDYANIGDLSADHNFSVNYGNQITFHVSVDRQYTVKNVKTVGIVLPPDCRREEKEGGLTVLMCGNRENEVPVANLPELRSFQIDSVLHGRTLTYPATIKEIPPPGQR